MISLGELIFQFKQLVNTSLWHKPRSEQLYGGISVAFALRSR